jgi:DNA gyrase/topoisomerase IV subunit B
MSETPSYDAQEIVVLKGLEVVRRRPTMYVGDLGDTALPARLLMQALCHAADCAVDGVCTRVDIRIAGANVRVHYDAGMPLDPNAEHADQAALIFLMVLAACHHRKRHLRVGDELCEIGLMVLNALSETLTVETAFSGWAATYRFGQGQQLAELPLTETSEADHTSIAFRLDAEILGSNVLFDRDVLAQQIDRVQGLLPRLMVSVSD